MLTGYFKFGVFVYLFHIYFRSLLDYTVFPVLAGHSYPLIAVQGTRLTFFLINPVFDKERHGKVTTDKLPHGPL